MRLIVDVYNAMHAWLGLGVHGVEPSVKSLSQIIGLSRYQGNPAQLVCDGVSRAGQPAMTPLAADDRRLITVIYAGPGRDADSLIERLIERADGPRELIVVSSDRRIAKAARKRKAKALDSPSFMLQVLADAERARAAPRRGAQHPGAPSPAEVAEWMRFFGLDAPDPHDTDPEQDDHYSSADVDRLLAGIDPKDLDMARWLDDDEPDRTSPAPTPGADILNHDDEPGTHE